MMDKAQRKGKNVELLNASDEPEDRRHHLTNYAYETAEEELFL